jgi:quinol monooxygenase YgiN
MILVNGFLKLRPGDVDRLQPAIVRQVEAARAFDGCLLYAFAREIGAPDTLRISERWRTRTIQAAHMISDHMVQFNLAMRAARVFEGELHAYEDGLTRKILEIPAQRFRGEVEDREAIVVMGDARFAPGEIDRLMPAIDTMLAATRAEDGCIEYSYARDVIDPDTVRVAERWRDRTALDAHFATPHMASFNAALATANIFDLSVKAYDARGERTLMGD